jgi:hypothetical protein
MSTPKRFTHLRPLLFTIVYEILGSATESDDMLQDSNLRWGGRGPGGGAGHQVVFGATGERSGEQRAAGECPPSRGLRRPVAARAAADRDDRDASADVVLAESESMGSRRPRGGPAFVAAGCKGRRMAPAMSTTPHAGTVQASAGVVTDEAADVRQKGGHLRARISSCRRGA